MHSIPLYLASSSVQLATHRVSTSWEWYVVRAAGFMAAILVVMLIISGIGQVTGFTYRFVEPIKAWAIHKAMALALVASVFIHVLFVFLDHYVSFSIPQIFIPFVAHYNNGTQLLGLALGTFAITFGIFAAYGILAIVASSLGWIDSKQKIWRWIHYSSYPVALFVYLHVLYSGTDVKYGIFRLAWIAVGVVIALGIVSRLRRAGTLKDNE